MLLETNTMLQHEKHDSHNRIKPYTVELQVRAVLDFEGDTFYGKPISGIKADYTPGNIGDIKLIIAALTEEISQKYSEYNSGNAIRNEFKLVHRRGDGTVVGETVVDTISLEQINEVIRHQFIENFLLI